MTNALENSSRKSLKILHTSDWHLGSYLYGRKRYDEFSEFLNWLYDTITQEHIDALLVAGDVFDTSTPSNRAQELYYRFLCRVSASCCRYIIIIAGNHDSPSFLNAPKELLLALNVHVVGAMTQTLADEVIVLSDELDHPQAIVCAVPYLRDKDIRTVEPGETIDDKNSKLLEGLKNHYREVCALAELKQSEFETIEQVRVPIIAMGHLFAAGGKTIDGDGVRELYVGTLVHMSGGVFPASIDYCALGHLHVPQDVGNAKHIRYCGSPIPMGYSEAMQDKKVIVVQFNNTTPCIQEIVVPCFQSLKRIVGSLDEIQERIQQLKLNKSRAWLEVEYVGREIVGNLREKLDEAVADSAMEILRIKNRQVIDRVMNALSDDETLDDLDASDVFKRCLDTFSVPIEDRDELTVSYNEIIKSLQEQDSNAE